ncbi:NADP-dependent alcohol dehydrogenase C domain protein [Mycobacterium xenopi 4042]|uniref:NADP-dependent alcohol dehydrogenase C domain protein n=1 Tax=Mycobacterium xenopi 4042 TaxID=1299334 RepID=X7Z584_MYCXE|nr:NADP-dependent alcohol dehydrogenase C domain protein [Mycobacterium xenopi 4042]
MSTVSAYAATSATEPLTKTTITRRDPAPRRGDRHQVLRYLPLGYPHCQSRMGQPNYPSSRVMKSPAW